VDKTYLEKIIKAKIKMAKFKHSEYYRKIIEARIRMAKTLIYKENGNLRV